MGAQEERQGSFVGGVSFHASKGLQALAGKSFGEEGWEGYDGGLVGELLVGRGQEQFDGLGAEASLEVAREPDCGRT